MQKTTAGGARNNTSAGNRTQVCKTVASALTTEQKFDYIDWRLSPLKEHAPYLMHTVLYLSYPRYTLTDTRRVYTHAIHNTNAHSVT